MAEYIDQSDTETVFREIRKRLSAKKKDYVAIEYLIKDQMLSVAEEIVHAIPAADVVEVVRCKDCAWCHAGYCEKYDDLIPFGCANKPWEDWFCADGRRRANDV